MIVLFVKTFEKSIFPYPSCFGGQKHEATPVSAAASVASSVQVNEIQFTVVLSAWGTPVQNLWYTLNYRLCGPLYLTLVKPLQSHCSYWEHVISPTVAL